MSNIAGIRLRQIAVSVVVGLVVALCASSSQDPFSLSQMEAAAEALWLPADATLVSDSFKPIRVHNGRSIYIDGTAAVVFSVTATARTYPDNLFSISRHRPGASDRHST